ncbi:hypothetical protein [Metabacillus sp. Hm71]|uniref:hypothetical protein n=1 Tax=Metabacillus sp. Hm71 TaxID=3450743 RepID=UPI003F442816
MILDHKKRKIQQKYRESMQQKKASKKHTLEAIFIIAFFILLGFLVFRNYLTW